MRQCINVMFYLIYWFSLDLILVLTSQTETSLSCHEDLSSASDIVQVRQKGAEGLKKESLGRGDNLFVTAGEEEH